MDFVLKLKFTNFVILDVKKKLRPDFYNTNLKFNFLYNLSRQLHSDYRHGKHQDIFIFFKTINRFQNSWSVWLRHFQCNIIRA